MYYGLGHRPGQVPRRWKWHCFNLVDAVPDTPWRGLPATVSVTPPKEAPCRGLPSQFPGPSRTPTLPEPSQEPDAFGKFQVQHRARRASEAGQARPLRWHNGISSHSASELAQKSQYGMLRHADANAYRCCHPFQDGTVVFPHRSADRRSGILHIYKKYREQTGARRLKPTDPDPAPKPGSRSIPHHTRCRRTVGGIRPPRIRPSLVQGGRMTTLAFPTPASGLSARGRLHASRAHWFEMSHHIQFVLDTRRPL